MKTVAVLGSNGQIGKYLKNFLSSLGYNVKEFDVSRNPEEDMTIIPNLLLEETIKNSDFVYFLAFDVGGSRYLEKYQYSFKFIDNNIRIMMQTFSLLEKYNIPFIFASSQMSNMSHSPYGVLKHVGELYTRALNGLIVKFWNVYGFESDLEKSHVITDFIKKGMECDNNGSVAMLTDGTEERQFLYAEDCCEALEIIMNRYKTFSSSDNLHITSYENTSINNLSLIVSDLFMQEGKTVRFIPAAKKDTVQQDKKNIPDEFLKRYWKPKTTLPQGISFVYNDMKRKRAFHES